MTRPLSVLVFSCLLAGASHAQVPPPPPTALPPTVPPTLTAPGVPGVVPGLPGIPQGPAGPPTTPAVDDAAIKAALEAFTKRDPNLIVVRDPKGRPECLVGDLADAAGGDLDTAGRSFIETHAAALGVKIAGQLKRVDLQDGTPVRLVRFVPIVHGFPVSSSELQVVFDKAGKVIAFSADDWHAIPGVGGAVPGPGGGGYPVPPIYQPPPLPPGLPGPVTATAPVPPIGGPGLPPGLPGGGFPPIVMPPPPTTEIRCRFADALARVGPQARMRADTTIQIAWVVKPDGQMERTALAEVETENPPGTWRFAFNEDGSVKDVTQVHASFSGKVYQGYPELDVTEVPLLNLTSERVLDGRYVKTRQGDNERAHPTNRRYDFDPEPEDMRRAGRRLGQRLFNPDFLEVNVYHHISKAHAMVKEYGCDALDSPVSVNVLTPYESMANNAYYSPQRHEIEFISLSAHNPAADESVILHEYGHAIFHKLGGANYLPEAAHDEERAVNEGFADSVAILITGHPIEGDVYSRAKKKQGRDARNSVRVGPGEPHDVGRAWSGLFWELTQDVGKDTVRRLMLGAAQLSPRPRDHRRMGMGLLIADRFFDGGKNAARVRSVASRRGIEL